MLFLHTAGGDSEDNDIDDLLEALEKGRDSGKVSNTVTCDFGKVSNTVTPLKLKFYFWSVFARAWSKTIVTLFYVTSYNCFAASH